MKAPEKEFLKRFDSLCHGHTRGRVFHDWVTMASSALIVRANPNEAERTEADFRAVGASRTFLTMKDYSKTTTEKIEAEAALKGWRMSALCKAAGVNYSTWWRWKSNRYEPRAASVSKLRRILNTKKK